MINICVINNFTRQINVASLTMSIDELLLQFKIVYTTLVSKQFFFWRTLIGIQTVHGICCSPLCKEKAIIITSVSVKYCAYLSPFR